MPETIDNTDFLIEKFSQMPAPKRIFLALPPNYSYFYDFPPLGTPCLTGFLKARGYPVTQIDHNMAYLDFLESQVEGNAPADVRPDILVKSLLNSIYEKKSRGNLYYSCLLPGALDPHVPYQDNTNSSFYFTEQLLASEHLERYLEDEEENTFLRFFLKEKIADQILDGRHNLLGLSIISPAQVLPSLTLCNLVKKIRKDFPILWGGQWPSLFREELSQWPPAGKWIDGVITDEGETPLYEYLQALEGKQSLSEVPNLLFFENGKCRVNPKRTEEDLDSLPTPDFDGMPVSRYSANVLHGRRTITYQTSRECYFNRCTYCVDLPFPKHTYRERSLDLVVRDIRTLQSRHGAEELVLSDLAMAPRYMKQLSQRLLDEKISIRWWTFARLDGGFTPEHFELAHRAGCYRVSFGFESGNQRVCDFIDKGTKLRTMSRVIKECGSSGIKVTAQTMVGLPSETVEEALDTVAFLLDHREFLDNVCYNIYYLTPGNYIYRDLEKNQIVINQEKRVPFQFFLGFRHLNETGITRDKAQSLIALYQKQAESPKQTPSFSGEDMPRFTGGTPAVVRIRIGGDEAVHYCYPVAGGGECLVADERVQSVLEQLDGQQPLQSLVSLGIPLEEVVSLCQKLAKSHLLEWTSPPGRRPFDGSPLQADSLYRCP